MSKCVFSRTAVDW